MRINVLYINVYVNLIYVFFFLLICCNYLFLCLCEYVIIFRVDDDDKEGGIC